MSANNQTLVQEHEGTWYVFPNVMAESWDDNILEVNKNTRLYRERENALTGALKIEEAEPTEYGVHFGKLAKDGAVPVIRVKSE